MSDGVSKALSALTPPGIDIAPQEYVRQDTARKIVNYLARAKNPVLEGLKVGGAKAVSRRMYPQLVELKIAGRSAEDIARRLNISLDVLRPHLQRAMDEYRTGRLNIAGGNAVEEARAVGAERAGEFTDNISGDSANKTMNLTLAVA